MQLITAIFWLWTIENLCFSWLFHLDYYTINLSYHPSHSVEVYTYLFLLYILNIVLSTECLHLLVPTNAPNFTILNMFVHYYYKPSYKAELEKHDAANPKSPPIRISITKTIEIKGWKGKSNTDIS